jgi:hypothetical protein
LESRYSGKIRRTVSSAALIIAEVRNVDGTAKDEIRLDATQAKGNARTVFVNDKLRKVEILGRLQSRGPTPRKSKGGTGHWHNWLGNSCGFDECSADA